MRDCHEQVEQFDRQDPAEEHPLLTKIKTVSSDAAAVRREGVRLELTLNRLELTLNMCRNNMLRQEKRVKNIEGELAQITKECEALLEERNRAGDDLVSFWTLPLHQRLWKAALGKRNSSHDNKESDCDSGFIDKHLG